MPKAGNSTGSRYAEWRGRSKGPDYTPEEQAALDREWRESPKRYQGTVRRLDAHARADRFWADDLSDRIAKHAHFAGPVNAPQKKDTSTRDDEGYDQRGRVELRDSLVKTSNDFYNKFDNPAYAGTPGRDRENENSRRAMEMDAKARARQAARSRNNPTNPNDR